MTKTILIVDDEEDLVKVTMFRLKSMGYNVIIGGNGQDAIDMIGKERPDLVLLDLRLPVMDGIEVCRKVKSDDNTKDIPIVLFTASTNEINEQAGKAGADGFLVKPFEREHLNAVIEKFLGGPGK